MKPRLRVVHLNRIDVLDMLNLDEAVLRASKDNWCLFARNSSAPTVVLGISGKPSELLHEEACNQDGVRLIKRFSGGGTVLVDTNTLFVSFALNHADVAGVEPFPRPIMEWSGKIYGRAISKYLSQQPKQKFQLNEHDYCFGSRKFGGNAQSLTKDRWLHHTSLLYSYSEENLANYLTIPKKQPEYRENRPHSQFLCSISESFVETPSPAEIFESLTASMAEDFQIESAHADEVLEVLSREYRRSNKVL